MPTILPGEPVDHPGLQQLVLAGSPEQLAEAAGQIRLNVSPPTDNSPYFFNMLRLRELKNLWGILVRWDTLPGGVVRGNLVATAALAGLIFSLAVLAITTILVPLLLSSRAPASAAPGGANGGYPEFSFSLAE